MIQSVLLKNDVYWLGVLDPNLDVFDIIMETKYGTTYNSYLVNTTEGAILVETVKEKFFDSYLQKIEEAIGDLSQIKYIITNHTEPDHAGSIGRLVKLIPGLTVIGSKTAITYLKDILNINFNYLTADSLKTFTLGEKTFDFIPAPFLHWPDSMYTYLSSDNVLFTCDSFGSHYSPKHGIKLSEVPASEEEAFQDALLYYYTAIFSPFKPYVIKAINKINDLKLDMVCTGHGPVLDTRIDEIIETYRNWSTPAKKEGPKKVVMPYVSAYGYTGELAEAITKGIHEVDPTIQVIPYNLDILNYPQKKDEILAHFADADGILLGTCTINGDALPIIWDLSINLNPIVHGGKIVSAFGSYGWSGEGVDNIMDRLHQLRMKVIDGFKIKFRASESETQAAIDFGKLFANSLLTGKVPARKKETGAALTAEELNPSGKVVLWRCIICGEVYPGVLPPEVCPACGVGSDLFEIYEEEVINFKSTADEKFVIVGGGVAAVTAANAIRVRNEVASITMISAESSYPYYRPALSDLIVKDVPAQEFNLNPENWYTENHINVQLNTKVTALNVDEKVLTLEDGSTVAYDKLILATGTSNFIPPIPGTEAEGIFSIKYKTDALALRNYAKGKQNAVIIGGGVLGLEAADALQELGLNITVLEVADRLMPRQLDESTSSFISNILAERKIDVRTGVQVQEIINSNGQVSGVKLADETINADVVVISAGVRANTQLATMANIQTNHGIVVNNQMQTSVADIYACGDVAEFEGISTNLWAPAIDQGKVAGINAVGDHAEFSNKVEPLSLIAFDTEVFAMGTYPTENIEEYQILLDSNAKTGHFKKLYFKEDELVYGVLFKDISKASVLLTGVRNGDDYATVVSKLYR